MIGGQLPKIVLGIVGGRDFFFRNPRFRLSMNAPSR